MASKSSPGGASAMNVCPVCHNRRWLPLPWERLAAEITWETADYYMAHEPEKFHEPCPECNPQGLVLFAWLPDVPDVPWGDQPIDMSILNPAFRPRRV